MPEILKERWFWFVVLAAVLIISAPLIVVWLILQLDPIYKLVATLLLVLLWGVTAGYKDWILSKRKEEEEKKSVES